MTLGNIARLAQDIIDAGIPIDGCSGAQGSVRIDFRPEATQGQRNQAQNIADNFNWPQAAHNVWLNLRQRTTARNNLTHTEQKLLRAAVDVLREEINILRGLHSLAPRPLVQVRNAILNKIDSGDVD